MKFSMLFLRLGLLTKTNASLFFRNKGFYVVCLVYFLGIGNVRVKAQTQGKLIKELELEIGLNQHAISFGNGAPGFLGETLSASGVQLGITIPIASNTALIGQFELQKQYNLETDFYCDVDCGTTILGRTMTDPYLVKPFWGIGIRQHFMNTGLWIQAQYLGTYAPFYSGNSRNGYRNGGNYYNYYNYYNYSSNDYYSVITFVSNPSLQHFWRFSMGYQVRPFKKSGLGFGLGFHSTYGKNEMVFDLVANGNRGEVYSGRDKHQITQKMLSFSCSFFVPLRELRKQ